MQPFVITTVTAFVAIAEDGDEGVLSAQIGDTHFPLICSDDSRMTTFLSIAESIRAQAGVEYRIVQFTTRTDVTEAVKEKFGGK